MDDSQILLHVSKKAHAVACGRGWVRVQCSRSSSQPGPQGPRGDRAKPAYPTSEDPINATTDADFLVLCSYNIPNTMKVWGFGDPNRLTHVDKSAPQIAAAEVPLRIGAIAACATDLEIIRPGPPSKIQGGLPFNMSFTPDHKHMGAEVWPGPRVDESPRP